MDAGTGFGGDVRQAFDNQVAYCEKNGAPITARVVRAVRDLLDSPDDSPLLTRIRDWSGSPLADALPLRTAGGLHALHLSGAAPELAPLYDGAATDDMEIVRRTVQTHAEQLMQWLDSPPQTNEAGRSSGFVATMPWLADHGMPATFELLEIGSSAGINLMIDLYRYDLGGVIVGPEEAAMSFAPEWRGPPPPGRPLSLMVPEGCDVAPLDLTDPEHALRLKAYIWPEHTVRFARLQAAVEAARTRPPRLVQMHAADFVEERLAREQQAGTTRVVMHSIVWQYLPGDEKQRITAAIEAAGQAATPDRALAWIALEADRVAMGHSLQVRYWPGEGETHRLAMAHAHGAWLEWLAS